MSTQPSPAAQLVEATLSLQSEQVTFWLRPEDNEPNVAVLEQIWSEHKRGAGHASRVMRAILDQADQLGVELRLQVHWLAYDPSEDDPAYDELWALNDQKLGNRQLYEWYARLGFVPAGALDPAEMESGEQKMVRPPHPAPIRARRPKP